MSELVRVAEALWRHEVADLRAARTTRDTMLFSEQSESIQQKWRGFAAAALAAARPDREGYIYGHMCRDDHLQIGHKDSEHEQCPLCRALGELERLHEKNGWQSTADVIAQLRGCEQEVKT